MRKAGIIPIALLIAGLLSLGVAVQAQSPPHVFVGEATLDRVPVPDGIIIRAIVNGLPLSGAETAVRDGTFTLIVEQPEGVAAADTVIGFAVGDYAAEQAVPWEMGQLTLLTLQASSALPAIPVEIDPPLPERLVRGEGFLLTVKADTGFYKATDGGIRVSFDPLVFVTNLDENAPVNGKTQHTVAGQGTLSVDWTYSAPTSTATQAGELISIPVQVRDAAPTGSTTISIDVSLTGPNGRTFPLEPSQVSAEASVVSAAADFNEDNLVDFADLAALGSVWGKDRGEPEYGAIFDLDGDGSIWLGDLVILLESYRAAD